MRVTKEIPEHRFPLFAELLGRTDEAGLEGQVARVLAEGGVNFFVLEPQDFALVDLVRGVPARALLMPVATLRPVGTMWVEYTSPAGHRRALLSGSTPEDGVWVRSLRRRDGESAAVFPSAVSRGCPPTDDDVDWSAFRNRRWGEDKAADDRWTQWLRRNLILELRSPGVDVAQSQLLTIYGIRDLFYLSLAISPLVMPELEPFRAVTGL